MSIEMPDLPGLRKSEREFFGQYVIAERQKWRDFIRKQADKIQHIVESVDGAEDSKKKAAASLRKVRTAIAVRVNPDDCDKNADKKLMTALDDLIVNCQTVDRDALVAKSKTVIEEISWLLKHDWERVKYEARPIWHLWNRKKEVDRINRTVPCSSELLDAALNMFKWVVFFAITVGVIAGLQREWNWLAKIGEARLADVATSKTQPIVNNAGNAGHQSQPITITVTNSTASACPVGHSGTNSANVKKKADVVCLPVKSDVVKVP